MKQEKELMQKVSELFQKVGWIVKEGVWIDNQRSYFCDIVLITPVGELVGVVETKLHTRSDIFLYEKQRALKVLEKEHIQFYMLFCNEDAYIYTKRGFIRLNKLPSPQNYLSIVNSDTIENEEIDDTTHHPKMITDSAPHDELTQIRMIVEELYKTQQKDHETINELKEGQKVTHSKLDILSEKIEKLAVQINDYQSLASRQLEMAESESEIERIVASFSEEVIRRIQQSFIDSFKQEELKHEERIIAAFFDNNWRKVSEESRKYLVTAKLMFKKQIDLGDLVDYSGVSLLVTKALEKEMANRFYSMYISYLRNRFGNCEDDLQYWPDALVDSNKEPITNRSIKMELPEYKFTMGKIAFILCKKFNRRVNQRKQDSDLNLVIEYANSELFENKLSFDEAKKVLDDIANKVEYVRENFRNPSAHKNKIVKESAETCIKYVIEVERIMVKILNYLKV